MEGTRRKWRVLFCCSWQVHSRANNPPWTKDNLSYNLLSNPRVKSLFLHGMKDFPALNSLLIMGLKLLITDKSLHFKLFSAHSFNCSRPKRYCYTVSLNGLEYLPPYTYNAFLHDSLRTITKNTNKTQKPSFQLAVLGQQCLDFRNWKNQYLQNGKSESVHISCKATCLFRKKWHFSFENTNDYSMGWW